MLALLRPFGTKNVLFVDAFGCVMIVTSRGSALIGALLDVAFGWEDVLTDEGSKVK